MQKWFFLVNIRNTSNLFKFKETKKFHWRMQKYFDDKSLNIDLHIARKK